MSRKEWEEESLEREEQSERRDPRSRSTIKYLRYLLLLVMVMVALIFLFSNRDQINGDNFKRLMAKINIGFSAPSAEKGEVQFETSNTGETVVYKDGFANATVEKLLITDKNGGEFQNTPLGFRNPCLLANSKYVMAYDSGGTGLLIADSFSVLYEANMENNIITAQMNDDGSFVIVTEGDGYLSKVYVYDASFREIYRYRSLNRYILDAALSPDKSAIAVSAMNIEGAEITAEIQYFKLNKEEMEWSVSFGQTPCVDLDIKDNGNICGLFSWGLVALNKKGNEQGRYALDNQVLQCYSVDDDLTVFAVSAAENGNTTLVTCNSKAAVKDTVALDYYVTQLDYSNGRIAAMGNRKCGVYNSNGKLLWEAQPDRATGIALMGRNTVVVMSETKCIYDAI